jgi:hypothetical protein
LKRTESDTVFDAACVGYGLFERAVTVHVVLEELTVGEGAFNEPTVWKTGSSKNAIRKSAFHEVADVEKSLVPVDVFERTTAEVGGDVPSFWRQAFEVAILEVVIVPFDCGEVLGSYCFCFHVASFNILPQLQGQNAVTL